MSRVLVVKIGGSVLDDVASMRSLWAALCEAHAGLAASGGGLIIVHGGGKAVDEQIAALGMTTRKHEGLRITPPEQIDVVAGVLAGVVNTRVVAALRAVGAPAVGVTLADAGVLEVERDRRTHIDLGLVGRVVGGNGVLLLELLRSGRLSVVASIGCDDTGHLLNVNADDAATGVAEAVAADALVVLTDVEGVLDANGRVMQRIDSNEVESLIADGVARGGMIAKLRSAAEAADTLGRPVMIAHVHSAGSLLAGEGVGTRIEPTRVRMEPTGP